VCNFCFSFFEKLLQAPVAEQQQQQLEYDSRATSPAPGQSPLSGSVSGRRNSMVSVLDQRHNVEEAGQEAILEDNTAGIHLEDPALLRSLLKGALDSGGLALGTHVYEASVCHNCFTGLDLVSWIRRQDNFLTDEKMATTIAQTLLDQGYVRPFLEKEHGPRFRGDGTPYKPVLGKSRVPRGTVDDHSSSVEEASFPD